MSRPESPKVTRAKELIKDKRLTNKQIALRCGITANYVSMLRRQMEVEKRSSAPIARAPKSHV